MIKRFIGTISAIAVASALLAGAMLATLSACEQSGPAEDAVEQIEKTGDSIGDTMSPSNE